MTSQVAIANLALTKLGSYRITSLDQDTEPARVLSSIWDQVRDAELREHNYNFSIVRVSIPALADAPAWGFARQFQLPSDCLKIIQVGTYFPGASLSDYVQSSTAPYKIEGRKILTDYAAPLALLYVGRMEDTGQWDSTFTESFACRLAIESCERITKAATRMPTLKEMYARATHATGTSDATENPPEELADSSWILSRL